MTRFSIFLAAAFLAATAPLTASDMPSRDVPSPVLVELFTSEGCSDCPPADALLQKFDSSQPVAGAQLIVLSEHVDYWNHIGWTDPYSSRFFSDRQSSYSDVFKLQSVYTPQMVVDGTNEFVGNNPSLAAQALQQAVTRKKIPVHISGVSLNAQHVLQAHVEAGSLPATSKAEVYLAVALNHAESQVLRGENGGRRLTHAAVVQTLEKIGKIEAGKDFSQDVHIKVNSKTDVSNLRVIAFVQETGQKRVLGAAMEKVK
jgi:hypothetical protein